MAEWGLAGPLSVTLSWIPRRIRFTPQNSQIPQFAELTKRKSVDRPPIWGESRNGFTTVFSGPLKMIIESHDSIGWLVQFTCWWNATHVYLQIGPYNPGVVKIYVLRLYSSAAALSRFELTILYSILKFYFHRVAWYQSNQIISNLVSIIFIKLLSMDADQSFEHLSTSQDLQEHNEGGKRSIRKWTDEEVCIV